MALLRFRELESGDFRDNSLYGDGTLHSGVRGECGLVTHTRGWGGTPNTAQLELSVEGYKLRLSPYYMHISTWLYISGAPT
jgi:hypothetical protein